LICSGHLRTPAKMFSINYSLARTKERRASGCCGRVSTFQMFRICLAQKTENTLCGILRATFFFITTSRFMKKLLAITHSDFRASTSPLRTLHFLLDFGFY
jgi:hypothetical protein